MPMDKPLVEEVLVEDHSSRDVLTVEEVEEEPAVGVNENFASTIVRVRARVTRRNGRHSKVSLIAKEMPTAEKQLQFINSHHFFTTEIKMYEHILPTIEDILKEQSIPAFWPRYYGKKGNYLIFSDLKSKNYAVRGRDKRLDDEHMCLLVRSIALFHAAGLSGLERGLLPGADGLPPPFIVRNSKEVEKVIGGGVRLMAKTIIDSWGPQWKDLGERLYKKALTLTDELHELSRRERARLCVVAHGDLWFTNMMFKYSRASPGKPIGVRLVDWQLAHNNSFMFELMYPMATSLPAHLRRGSAERYLSLYQASLSEALHSFGLARLAPDLDEVMEEYRRCQLYMLAALISINPIVNSDLKDTYSFDIVADISTNTAPQHPVLYQGSFREEVQEDLLNWYNQGLF